MPPALTGANCTSTSGPQMCNTTRRRRGDVLYRLTYSMSRKKKMLTREKKNYLVTDECESDVFLLRLKKNQGSLLMVTRSSPLNTKPDCCFLPINSVRGAEEASCILLHTWINLLPPCNLAKQVHVAPEEPGGVFSLRSARLCPAADIVYTCRLQEQHSEAALCWHPGQNGIIK